jgi:hypothetical protein
MDILSMLIGFVGGGSVLATALIAIVKQKIKEAQENRFTDLVILGALFIISFVIAITGFLLGMIPDQIAGYGIAIFSGAITLFEVFYKAGYEKALKGKGVKKEEVKG